MSPTLEILRLSPLRDQSLRLFTACMVIGLAACQRSETPTPPTPAKASTATSQAFYSTPFERTPEPAAMTELGRLLFMDPSLSASGKQACASCHDPAHFFGPADARPVQLGGADLALPGVRAVPSLTYQQNVPSFSEHFQDDDGDDSVDQGPTGGRDWDGRAASAHDQAKVPLFSPFEMANADPAAVVSKVAGADYAAKFRDTFGEHLFDDPDRAFKAVLMSLEVFQQSPAEFYPYTSKYDAFLRAQVQLTPQEARGLEAFNDPARGNCAACHPSGMKQGAFPAFTDYGFIAIGVPRNREIPANSKADYFDLGLCGPYRTDLSDHQDYCGRFRTPSLRNVAQKKSFFHNGIYHDLKQVLEFYAQRDTNPERFYPRDAKGAVRKFDDLPEAYWQNVNVEPPFDRQKGGRPALSKQEIEDVIAFLRTLDDGYRAGS